MPPKAAEGQGSRGAEEILPLGSSAPPLPCCGWRMALMTTGVDISSVECLDRETLATQQACRLERLLAETYRRNPFYKRKLGEAGVAVHALRLPNDLARSAPSVCRGAACPAKSGSG